MNHTLEDALNFSLLCAKEFQQTFNGSKDPVLYGRLILEESHEVQEAHYDLGFGPATDPLALTKEVADWFYVVGGLLMCAEGDREGAMEVADFIEPYVSKTGDLIAELPLSWDEIITAIGEVHNSNMSKLGDDGEVLRRDDGKVMKGPNYKEPDMSVVFRREAPVAAGMEIY